MANENKGLAKRVELLWSRIEDKENRNRRNNIRLIGLKEAKEAGSAMNDYIKKILSDGLGLTGDEYKIERSHRSLRLRRDDNQPPRMILVKFLRYTESSGSCKETSKNLSIYEDMTKERAEQRRRFSPIMKTLWEHQVKHTLAHPANLRFTWKGKRWSFNDPKKAGDFVQKNIQDGE